ncbi:uncharacterized protein LOC114351118 [Ostrinia furnacalis]|uniref:uncharacterized protein LOC114351118 n=1 Tax=Ostrinia furnacalis TaxID=93504 RepID=UPI00103E3A43|nr:uncharacterized protein LOC114351118 [Ostrinia furnacalis]
MTIVEVTEKVKETFDGVSTNFGGYLSTTQSLIVVFSPAFSAGLLVAEVQKIKLILHDKLYLERDQKHAKDIQRFISYIEARPLRFTVCKVIPLDWTLPFIVCNFCVTYIIVLVQFTHFYAFEEEWCSESD